MTIKNVNEQQGFVVLMASFKIFPRKDRNTGNGIGKVSFISKGM